MKNIIQKHINTREKLLNPSVYHYRLNNEQRVFYIELFNDNASNGKVKRENFLPLLGIFGTQIAQDFSDRMFLVLSKGEQEITLEQYLNYIDTYHYGDVHERCLYTCKLMDMKQKGKIELEDFQSYINLIINTVKKVNNTLSKKDLMNEKDIEYLFYHISKGKSFFTYNDFESIYQEKPELVSWFDYFKNDKEDILVIINENIQILLKVFNDFLCSFMNDLFLLLDQEKEINLELLFKKVLKYSNKLEKIMNNFVNKVSKFNITSPLYNLKRNNYNKRKLIYDLQNRIFESNNFNNPNKQFNDVRNENIDEFFDQVKKSLYKKEEKEFSLNENMKAPLNHKESNFFTEKFVKKSTIFRNRSFKFLGDYSNLRESHNSSIKRSSLSLNKSSVKNDNNKTNSNNNILNYNRSSNSNNKDLNQNLNINNYINNNNLNINNYNHLKYNNSNDNINPLYQTAYLNNYIYNNNYNNNYNYNIDTNNYTVYNYNVDTYDLRNSYNYNSSIDSTLITVNPLIDFYSLKESQKLKQLLFCSREIIEKSLEINVTFNNCYKWILDNYLVKPIQKKKKEEKFKSKKKFNRKNSYLNIPRKMVPIKKKIIGASEKSFEILFNMIMGIQIAVQAIPNFRIKQRDEIGKYLTEMLYSIQTIYLGKENEESYLLKEFGGVIFNNIRLYLGINKDDFIKSISPQDFITELMISSQTIFEELCSTGSSGSLLYYTRDGEFIVKTISKKEYKFLKKILGEYYFYIKDNPLSFLPKLLGCYVLKRKYKKNLTNIYFIVMTNVFATSLHIDLRFDLKGSTIGRSVLTGTISDAEIFKNGDMALKDLDFNKMDEKVDVGNKRDIILKQLKKDVEFLNSINSNDYSLLLGIHYIKDNEKYCLSRDTTLKTDYNKKEESSFISGISKEYYLTNNLDIESSTSSEKSVVDRLTKLKGIYDFEDGGILSSNKNRVYYFGIIDILTEFNKAKHLEYFFKRIRYCSDKMSCIPPIDYKDRFYNYLNTVFQKKKPNSLMSKTLSLNISNNNKIFYNVDKFGAISSSRYNKKQKKEQDIYTMEDSLQKFS